MAIYGGTWVTVVYIISLFLARLRGYEVHALHGNSTLIKLTLFPAAVNLLVQQWLVSAHQCQFTSQNLACAHLICENRSRKVWCVYAESSGYSVITHKSVFSLVLVHKCECMNYISSTTGQRRCALSALNLMKEAWLMWRKKWSAKSKIWGFRIITRHWVYQLCVMVRRRKHLFSLCCLKCFLHKASFLYNLLPFFSPVVAFIWRPKRTVSKDFSGNCCYATAQYCAHTHQKLDCVNALFPKRAAWLLMRCSEFSSPASFCALIICTFCYLFFNITW